ncbi:PrpF domain-containing protein, partial [Pseudomonas aeruginosa]
GGGRGRPPPPPPPPRGRARGAPPPPPPAAIPGTLVNLAAGGGERSAVRFGHPSGTLRVGAEASQANGEWTVTKAIMSRSARILMEGWVRVPGEAF